MTWPTYVEVELDRCRKLVAKDHEQRWVLMDGKIMAGGSPQDSAIPFSGEGEPMKILVSVRLQSPPHDPHRVFHSIVEMEGANLDWKDMLWSLIAAGWRIELEKWHGPQPSLPLTPERFFALLVERNMET